MANIKGFNTNANKGKMARLQTLFKEFYEQEDFLIGISSNYLQLSSKSFKDLSVKGTVKYVYSVTEDHIEAVTSNNLRIVYVMDAGETIDDYK
ncbi:hypothetical protein KAR91_29110 [Candidatus Pacearchaeota archaeon]|nr:hypothetical protein [Candidatus Pacearchaeota archaeon]